MSITYHDDESRLIQAAKDLAVTTAEQIIIEKLEDRLEDAIELGHREREVMAKRELKEFIRARTQ